MSEDDEEVPRYTFPPYARFHMTYLIATADFESCSPRLVLLIARELQTDVDYLIRYITYHADRRFQRIVNRVSNWYQTRH